MASLLQPDPDYEYISRSALKRISTIADVLDRHACLTKDAYDYIHSLGALANTSFKAVENSIRRHMDDLRRNQCFGDPDIRRLTHIITTSNEKQESLGINNGPVLASLRQRNYAATSLSPLDLSTTKRFYLLKTAEDTYLLQHFDTLGRIHLPEYSPRMARYITLVAEAAFGSLLHTTIPLTSHWPSLAESLAAAEDKTDSEVADSILSEVIIQPFLSAHNTVKQLISDSWSRNRGISIFAEVIAEVQSASFGIARAFQERTATRCNDGLLDLLREHANALRFRDAHQYRQWLTRDSWLAVKLASLFVGDSPYLAEIRSRSVLTAQWFDALCERSVARFARGGCLTQFDLLPQNILVDNSDPALRMICDFEFLSFVDPALDLGMAIYAIAIQAIREGFPEQALTLVDRFLESYEGALKPHRRLSLFGARLNSWHIVGDAYGVAAVVLVCVCARDYLRRYDADFRWVTGLTTTFLERGQLGQRGDP
jgi:hypothetical protein